MKPPKPKEDPAFKATDLAKWMVPSAAALFFVMGYVIQSAQDSLLGFATAGFDANLYSKNSAEFLRDLVSLFNSAAFFDDLLKSEHTAALIVYFLIAVSLTTLLSLPVKVFREKFVAYRWRYLFCIVLIGLLLGKFVILDSPLAFVNDLVLFNGSSPLPVATTAKPSPFASPQAPPTRISLWERKFGVHFDSILSRAVVLRAGIECYHIEIGVAAPTTPPPGTPIDSCWVGHVPNPRTEFSVNLILQTLIVSLSLAMFLALGKSRSVAFCVIASFIYALTVPYAYGKLLKDMQFDAGRLKLTQPLQPEDGVSTGDDPGHLYGLIVSRDSDEVRVLYANRFEYSIPDGKPGIQIRLLSLAPSQVVSIAEIEARDPIEWSHDASPACLGDVRGIAGLTANNQPAGQPLAGPSC